MSAKEKAKGEFLSSIEVVEVLIQAGRTTEALVAFRGIRGASMRWVVKALTQAKLTQEAGAVFTEALGIARSIEYAHSRARALGKVAEALTQAGHTK